MYTKIALCSALIIASCSHHKTTSFDEVKDSLTLSQNLDDYNFDNSVLSLNTDLSGFYSAWQINNDISYYVDYYQKVLNNLSSSYSLNLLPRSNDEFEKDKYNADFSSLLLVNKKGLITRNSNLRALPTDKPYFADPAQAGEGYPFDYAQESYLYIGTPVRISHYSKDKAWAYVISNDKALGFVRSDHVMKISDLQAEEFQSYKLVPAIKDDVPLINNGSFVEYIKLGMLFPSKDGNILIPVNNKLTWIAKPKDVASHVLKFNSDNISLIANQMIGKEYGWGGLLGARDCSQFLKDFYTSFGLYLPRNSKDIANYSKNVIDLKEMSNIQKLEVISEQQPFSALLYKPGHITIYMGVMQQKPLVMQSLWGVRTESGKNRGRNITGKVFISTLEYGENHPYYHKNTSFINSVASIIVLKIRLYH